MNHAKSPIPANVQQLASRQLADYDMHNPGTMFSERIVMSVAEAYELQSAVAELRRQRGERIIGYKVGCTSPTIRKQLGIDHCVSGRLFASEQYSSGATLARLDFANLAIEGELAVELSREPDENVDDLSGDTIPACVARIVPVIELHNHVMRGVRPSAAELIANNAIHAGIVAGSGVRSKKVDADATMEIYVNEELIDRYHGPLLCQTIGSSLRWLVQLVRSRGECLQAGQLILTGAIPSLIPIREPCSIRVDARSFGSVEAKVI